MLTDYELFEKIKAGDDSARNEIFSRYTPLIRKQMGILHKKLSDMNIYSVDTDDYLGMVYEKPFINAVNSVKLEKIPKEKQKTWKFYVCINGYLMSFNRDLIHHALKDLNNTTNIDYKFSSDEDDTNLLDLNMKASPSVEDVFEENMEKLILNKAIKNSYSKYNDIQKQIFEDLQKGEKIKNIRDKLNLTPKSYKTYFNNMKEIMNSEIRKESIRNKYEIIQF